ESEIRAHTVQAASAKLDQLRGNPIDLRDQELINHFESGCPPPNATTPLDTTSDGMYSIVKMYHELYLNQTLNNTQLVNDYGREMRRAVVRYNDMVGSQNYTLSRNYKHIK